MFLPAHWTSIKYGSAERSIVQTDLTYSISKLRLTRSANRKRGSLDSESMIGQTSRQHKKMMKSSRRRRELQSSGISSERRSDPLDTALNKRMAAATLLAAPRLIFIAGVPGRYHPNRDPILRSDVTLTSSRLRIVTRRNRQVTLPASRDP